MPPTRITLARIAESAPSSSFAIVMATGIVAIAAHLHGYERAGWMLFGVAAVALIICWLLLGWRSACRWSMLAATLRNHERAPGYLTAVAGTAVVGSGCIALGAGHSIAAILLGVAAAVWLVLTYATIASLTIAPEKPGLVTGIDGSWLLVVVATQSLAVLAAMQSGAVDQPARMHLNFVALCAWLVGNMLYIWFTTLLLYRALFFPFAPADLTPPWWINMGAMAISTLAGAQLVLDAPDAPLLQSMLPFIRGMVALCWATGTWWIPLLVVLTAWRYIVAKQPLRYEFSQWSAVFPLGMYSVASEKFATAMDLPFLHGVSAAFLWLAVLAWLAVMTGFVRTAGFALFSEGSQA